VDAKMFLDFLYRKFIPKHIEKDIILFTLSKNLVGTSVIGCIGCLFFASYFFVITFYSGMVSVLILFVVFMTTPWIYKRSGSILLARELTVCSLTMALLWLTYQLGGLYSAASFWLLLPPFIAMFLDCVVCAVLWSLLINLALIIIYYYMRNSPTGMEHLVSYPLELQLVSLIGLNFVVMALAYLFVSVKRKSLNQLHYLAFHDVLTDLLNRTAFDDALILELEHIKLTHKKIALFYFDIDNFKSINDILGHRMGDAVLIEVALRISNFLNVKATLSRRGGDEFTLYYIYNEENELDSLGNTLLELIRQPFFIESLELHVRLSIGFARAPFDAEDSITLIRKADIALYQAKKSGKNNCYRYVEEIDKNFSNRLLIEQALPKALKNNELYLNYQPQFATKSLKTIVGLEALIRWESPTLGKISPDEFIPVAERLGLMKDIDSWAIETACKQYKEWIYKGFIKNTCKMSIHISAVELQVPNFADTLNNIISSHEVEPESIELEITETTLVKNQNLVLFNLKKIINLGINIAIDDFGTGYSSLSYLVLLQINTLKIDKVFIQQIPGNHSSLVILESIINLAHSLNLRTIAEGVETIEQMHELQRLNCDVFQGIYLSKPLSILELEKLFLQR
jgi:diguanylate cyclase (GGDEF)-like protein